MKVTNVLHGFWVLQFKGTVSFPDLKCTLFLPGFWGWKPSALNAWSPGKCSTTELHAQYAQAFTAVPASWQMLSGKIISMTISFLPEQKRKHHSWQAEMTDRTTPPLTEERRAKGEPLHSGVPLQTGWLVHLGAPGNNFLICVYINSTKGETQSCMQSQPKTHRRDWCEGGSPKKTKPEMREVWHVKHHPLL